MLGTAFLYQTDRLKDCCDPGNIVRAQNSRSVGMDHASVHNGLFADTGRNRIHMRRKQDCRNILGTLQCADEISRVAADFFTGIILVNLNPHALELTDESVRHFSFLTAKAVDGNQLQKIVDQSLSVNHLCSPLIQ